LEGSSENVVETEDAGRKISSIVDAGRKYSLYIFLAAALVILIATIFFRIPMLSFPGFYEPDGYYHYSLIRAAVNNGFAIPQIDPLSGWPPSCNSFASSTCGVPQVPHHEPFGLYWVTLIPYFFLRFAGFGYYDIQRLMPVVFGVLDVLLAYLLSRYWSRDRFFGLLVMALIALNMGNAARTSALIYRGDSFVTAFLLAALIATVAIFRTEDRKRKMAYMLLAGSLLSLCNLVWNGAPFATAVYIFSFVLMLILGFTYRKRELIADSFYMLPALILWFVLVAFYRAFEWIVSTQAFTGYHFFLLFIPMAAGWYFARYFTEKGSEHRLAQYFSTPRQRFLVAVGIVAITFLAIYIIIPGFVEEIFVTSGFDITNAFSSTIQELQSPNYQFLFASFNFQNFTNPMSIIVVLSTFIEGKVIVLWLLLLALFIPYFFMQVEGGDAGMMSGEARLRFDFNEATLIIISYFALTAYLQMNAIRFNSLLSVPMSIFSAFTIYWLILYLKRYRLAYYASFVLLALLLVFVIQTDIGYITGLAPADQINSQFLQAMAWMKNNTPANSVVLTLWPDGSVVEAVANRTSVTDSVGSQYAYKANPFAAWLYNSSPDPGFLLANITGAPDYLVVRQAWMYETGGIFTESGINISGQYYGYNTFSSLNERVNKTTQLYQFFGSGLEEDTVIENTTAGRTIASYLKFNQGIQPFGYVAFYNVVNGNWSIIRQTAFNVTNNDTFLIDYSPIPAPNLYVNITNAYMLGPALAKSNMIKFLFDCNEYACLWNNNVASLRLVYMDYDTKVFRILYNESNASVAGALAMFPRKS
jgi:asparagine N-glycosylation enzyme membrane subunit Stt3